MSSVSANVSGLSTKKARSESKFPLSLWLSFFLITISFGLIVQHTFDGVSQLKIYADTGLSINDLKAKVQSMGYQVTRALNGDAGAMNGISINRTAADQDLGKIDLVGLDTSKVRNDLQILDTIISPVTNQKNDLIDRAKAATILANSLQTLRTSNYANWTTVGFTSGLDKPATIAGFHNVETAIALKNWRGINDVIDKQLDVLKKTQGTVDNLSDISLTLAPFGEPNAMSKVSTDIDAMANQIGNFTAKKTENLIYLSIIFITLVFSSVFFMRSVIFSSNETSRIRKESKNLRVISANASTLVGKMSSVVDEQGVILSPNLQFERLSLTGAVYNLGASIQKILSSAIRMIRSTEDSTNQTIDVISSNTQNSSRLQTSLNTVEQHGTIVSLAIERSKEAQSIENATLKELTKEIALSIKNIHNLNDSLNKTLNQIDGVRDTSQGISKRIKRFAETSHAMSDNTASHRDIARQIKVLAMNAAVQSASSGSSGQRLMIIAKEIQRLSSQSVQHSGRMDSLVLTMRDEVQSSIDEMEMGIQLLVDTSSLAIKSFDQSKEILLNAERATKMIDLFKENDVILQEGHNTGLISVKRILSENQSSNETLKLMFSNMESLKDLSKQLLRLINERFPSHG